MIRATAGGPMLIGAAQAMPFDQWADAGYSGTAGASNTYSAAAFLNK